MRNTTPVQNHSLRNADIVGSISSTTTKDGKHSRYSSAFFISQIPFNSRLSGYLQAEFAKWLISGNKPSNRANNASRSFAVVETISHLTGENHLLTKQKRQSQMNISTLTPTGDKFPIVLTADVMEGIYA